MVLLRVRLLVSSGLPFDEQHIAQHIFFITLRRVLGGQSVDLFLSANIFGYSVLVALITAVVLLIHPFFVSPGVVLVCFQRVRSLGSLPLLLNLSSQLFVQLLGLDLVKSLLFFLCLDGRDILLLHAHGSPDFLAFH